MSGQRFYAQFPQTNPNGAIGWSPGGPFDCLGPYAKIEKCPVEGLDLTRTVYATGYADTAFSIPARCTIKGSTIKGYITNKEDGPIFIPYK